MTLEAKKLVGIILLLTIVSCGTKRKALKKTHLETKTEIVKNIIKTDSSITYLNISELQIIQKDSTQPIIIKDFKGNTTTFYNVKQINTKKDNSITKNKLNSEITQIATVGTTIQVEEKTKIKEPMKFNYWYIIVFVVIYLIIRKFIKTYFVWI